MPSVGVTGFCSKSGNFNFKSFKMNCYGSMFKARWNNCAEKLYNILWSGICSNIKIMRFFV